MRKFIATVLLSVVALYCFAPILQAEEKSKLPEEMKTYYLVFLLKGPNRSQAPAEAEKIQAAHLAHLGKMAEQGKLVMAGPLLDDVDLRGICVYDVESPEEAKKLAEADPAVKAGRLKVEVHPWMAKKGSKLP